MVLKLAGCVLPRSLKRFACSFRQALTPAPHLKSLFLRPDSRKCFSNICKYIEDEDEAVTYIRWLCSSCPKEILPRGKWKIDRIRLEHSVRGARIWEMV